MADVWIECVPNFSEGRNKKTIDTIASAITQTDGVKLLHIDPGYDANRTVMTFAGTAKAVVEAAFASAKVALELIDMRTHTGTHPRIGAVDVFPFVPLGNAIMADAHQACKQFAQRIAPFVPVYFYENSALLPERKNLAWLRKGEYEGLAEKMYRADFVPDLGKNAFNPKSGILITGAREFLLAYNINLKTKDVEIAKKIASEIRGSNPNSPFKYLKAIGWFIDDFNVVQVSTNITNVNQVPVHEVYEQVSKLAHLYGTQVTGSELIGLAPLHVLLQAGLYYAQHSVAKLSDKEYVDIAVEKLNLKDVKPFDSTVNILEWAAGLK